MHFYEIFSVDFVKESTKDRRLKKTALSFKYLDLSSQCYVHENLLSLYFRSLRLTNIFEFQYAFDLNTLGSWHLRHPVHFSAYAANFWMLSCSQTCFFLQGAVLRL